MMLALMGEEVGVERRATSPRACLAEEQPLRFQAEEEEARFLLGTGWGVEVGQGLLATGSRRLHTAGEEATGNQLSLLERMG
jgi:hypothetical protein